MCVSCCGQRKLKSPRAKDKGSPDYNSQDGLGNILIRDAGKLIEHSHCPRNQHRIRISITKKAKASHGGLHSGYVIQPPSMNLSVQKRHPGNRGKTTGRVQLLEVLLDGCAGASRDDAVYGPGDSVSGKLAAVCGGTFRFRSLSITLKGVARIVGESGSTGLFKGKKKQSEEVVYIEEKRYLRGGMGSGARERLPEGRHEFTFDFDLPPNPSSTFPTSFEGESGSVRYFLKAELDESYAASYHSYKAFTYVAPVDVEGEQFLGPVTHESEEKVGMKFLEGNVPASVSVEQSGYRPGEYIGVRGVFHNISPAAVRVELALAQVQTYQLCNGTKPTVKRVIVATGQAIQIQSGSDGHFGKKEDGAEERDDAQEDASGSNLRVPFFLAPTISNCPLLKVDYALDVSISGKGQLSTPAVISLPLTIGTWSRLAPSLDPSQKRATPANQCMVDLDEPEHGALINDTPPTYTAAVSSAGQLVVDLALEEENHQEGKEASEESICYGVTLFSPRYGRDSAEPPEYQQLFQGNV